jgi:hypothetical protein
MFIIIIKQMGNSTFKKFNDNQFLSRNGNNLILTTEENNAVMW